jgi:hypothetical protein
LVPSDQGSEVVDDRGITEVGQCVLAHDAPLHGADGWRRSYYWGALLIPRAISARSHEPSATISVATRLKTRLSAIVPPAPYQEGRGVFCEGGIARETSERSNSSRKSWSKPPIARRKILERNLGPGRTHFHGSTPRAEPPHCRTRHHHTPGINRFVRPM